MTLCESFVAKESQAAFTLLIIKMCSLKRAGGDSQQQLMLL